MTAVPAGTTVSAVSSTLLAVGTHMAVNSNAPLVVESRFMAEDTTKDLEDRLNPGM